MRRAWIRGGGLGALMVGGAVATLSASAFLDFDLQPSAPEGTGGDLVLPLESQRTIPAPPTRTLRLPPAGRRLERGPVVVEHYRLPPNRSSPEATSGPPTPARPPSRSSGPGGSPALQPPPAAPAPSPSAPPEVQGGDLPDSPSPVAAHLPPDPLSAPLAPSPAPSVPPPPLAVAPPNLGGALTETGAAVGQVVHEVETVVAGTTAGAGTLLDGAFRPPR